MNVTPEFADSSAGCRGVVRAVVTRHPFAFEGVDIKAICAFNYYAAAIHVGSQVIAQRTWIIKSAVAR